MKRQGIRMSREPMDDEEIVALFFEREEKAIEETDYKYGKYLYRIAYHVVHDKLDCEECLNDTYLGAWQAIPPSRPRVLRAFLTTMMRRIAIKRYERRRRKKAVPSEMTVALTEVEEILSEEREIDESLEAERLAEILSRFVRDLSERRRYIFMSRYYVAEPIDVIARELSLSRSMVNKELAAIRSALKEILEQEEYL